MSEEFVILVDQNDNPIGLEEKVKCHLPNGKLHRAFTALLFDKQGRLVLTKRSSSKMLWPGDWDGTVASHPREKETYVSSAERRMPEEIGMTCKFDYLFKFEYHVPYKNVGSENEICGTLIAEIEDESNFKLGIAPSLRHIGISSDELLDELKNNSKNYCPWMIIALYLLPSSKKEMLSKYDSLFSKWTKPEFKKQLEDSIKYHLPDNNWRLVN